MEENKLDNIYLFKVADYTTILLGRYENGKFFVQRGDGTKYEYDEYRIVWKQKLDCQDIKYSNIEDIDRRHSSHIKHQMDKLTDGERMAVMSNYCGHCGDKNPHCQCWNDD